MHRWLIYIFICTSVIVFYNAGADEDSRPLPKGMTEQKLKKSVDRQYKYIKQRLLYGKSADRILESNNSTAIGLLNKGRESIADIEKQITNHELKNAYFALQDLNASLKIALKLSRAKDVAIKQAQDDAETARIISDAYLDRAKQHNIDAGYGGSKALDNFNLAINLRSKASLLESKASHNEAKELYNQATDKLKAAIEIAKERESFDLEFKLTELSNENDRRNNEARELGIDKGMTGRRSLVSYEHASEKRAQGNDLIKAHEYSAAVKLLQESNKLLIKSIKQGKFHLSKKDESNTVPQNNDTGTEHTSILDYD